MSLFRRVRSTCGWKKALSTVALLVTSACTDQPTPTNPVTSDVVINEFVASNASGLMDASGAFPDWIELHNTGDEAVDVSSWTVTDDPDLPQRWSFPAGTVIEGSGFLILFADADPSTVDELHTSFRLEAMGEEILLVGPAADGLPVLDAVVYGAQETDVALARMPNGEGLFAEDPTPTPGAPNE